MGDKTEEKRLGDRRTIQVLRLLKARGCPKLEWKQIRGSIMTEPYILNYLDKLDSNSETI